MGSKSLLKLTVLVFLASQVTCKQWRISRDGSDMEISRAHIESDTDLEEVNFANVKEVLFDSPNIHILTVNMQKPMMGVKNLLITGGNLSTAYVGTHFETFHIDSNNLRTVVIDPASKYDTLTFKITNTRLTEIPEHITALKKVLELSFFNNKIDTLDMKVFNGLTSIRKLDLSRNRFTTLSFTDAVQPRIQSIHGTYNSLTSFDLDNFDAPDLEELDFKDNELQTIDMAQFNRFKNLDALYFAFNEIKEVTSNTVELPKLRVFSIGYNKLKTLSFETWNTPKIQAIIVEKNALQTVPGLMTKFPKLNKVWLYPNPFNCEWLTPVVKELEARSVYIVKDHMFPCKK